MARKVTVELVDDLNGNPITEDGGATVAFSFQRKSYEIDLTTKNIQKFEAALAPYIDAARPAEAATQAAPKRRRRNNGSRDLTDVRNWARANGHNVNDRGRISEPVLEAYDAAH